MPRYRHSIDKLLCVNGVKSLSFRISTLLVIVTASICSCTDRAVDSCLDNGGSFDYESCQCDYEQNHEYKENNQC